MAPAPKTLTRLRAIALVAAIAILAAGAAGWREVPHWRWEGTRSATASSVGYLPQPLLCPAHTTAVRIIGDSHVAGSRMEAPRAPFGEVFERALSGRISVALFSIGGATAEQGEQRWHGRDLPTADLVILAYGSNDAAPRGPLARRSPVAITGFKASLARQIAAWQMRGAEVILLAPPPGGSIAMADRLAPYRMAVDEVGRAQLIAVLDPADAFASCPQAQPVLTRDALHMNAAGHDCLGIWLAHQFCSPPP